MAAWPTLEEAQTHHAAVIKRLCTLSALVADHVYDYAHAADCFCRSGNQPWPINENWRYEDEVLRFIEEAVIQATAKKMRLERKQVRRLLDLKRI